MKYNTYILDHAVAVAVCNILINEINLNYSVYINPNVDFHMYLLSSITKYLY